MISIRGMIASTAGVVAAGMLCLSAQAETPAPPAPGESARIDAIRQAGELRVGALAVVPWLVENTQGGGEAWDGPAWALAKEYARLLDVKLTPVPVSHETKIPVLAVNQVDMTISPLAETPERLNVVDFVSYSVTSVCLMGLASNPKFAAAKSVDDLDAEGITIAFFMGGAEELWVRERFPKATPRGVVGSGATPVEELLSKRADAVPVNRISLLPIQRRVQGLAVLPSENNCQDSTEKASPVGIAVDKGQDVYLNWLRDVAKSMDAELTEVERRITDSL